MKQIIPSEAAIPLACLGSGSVRFWNQRQCPAVESIPQGQRRLVFKGTRTPVAVVFENLEDGVTIDEVTEQFPVSRDQVETVLEFAARSLDASAPSR
jgi:uncharacterized protein (DUF433 family)